MSDENKIKTDNDVIKEFQKEVLGKLDNPLVVHKKSDASYEENVVPFEMNETHNEEEAPTLMRHRFKKEKKNNSGSHIAVLFFIVILVAVFAGLYFTGNITFGKRADETTAKLQTTETTTSLAMKYEGKIVVKNTYIFVNGVEVDGIKGLQEAIEYETPSHTAYEIIDENANSDFLNDAVIPLLIDLKFYGKETVVTHVNSTGLMAADETTTLPPETTTVATSTMPAPSTTQNQ